MYRQGDFSRAEMLYKNVLEDASDEDTAHIYIQLGMINKSRGEHKQANDFVKNPWK